MMNPTQEACIYAIARMNPFTVKEITGVFETCKSLDATIQIVECCRETGVSFAEVYDVINQLNTAGVDGKAAGSKMQDIIKVAMDNSKFDYRKLKK